MTAWRAALAGWVLCALGGCALLKPGTDKAPEAPPPPAPVQVVVEAPQGDLRRLLDTHLDIARLARDAAGEEISEPELKRLENSTPAEARALLATEGYMAPEVRLQRETDDAATPPRPRVRITVVPGAQTQVESVTLDMAGPLADAAAAGDAEARETLAQWRAGWALPVGRDFTNPAWRAAKNSAIARLRSAGYAAATWQDTAADVDAARASAALAVRAESGPLFLTGPLVIEGLNRQDDKSVRNLAGFSPGTPATETLLLDYQERLQRSTLFERVSVTLDPDVASAQAAPVNVRVGEAPLQQATVGVGYSSNSGARVSLEHLHRRAFGQRATARNKLELGTLRRAWEGELASHALPGLYRNLLGGAAERVESDTDLVTSLRVRAGRSFDTQRIERLAFAEIERSRTRPVGADDATAAGVRSDVLALTANFHGVWRDLDSVVLPTRGHSYALQSNVGVVRNLQSDTSTLGEGGGPFSRLLVRGNWWRPLGERWYAHARAEVGQVFSRNDVAVPDTQRFRAGGDDSVRGYEWRSLTPSVAGVDVGGRVMATASVEVARPISERLPSIWWATFIDAGNAAERWSDFKPAIGVGVGLRVRSPVGPLRADVAYGEQTKKFRLHLSLGIAF
jgi:translocation and assembly module TamA